MIQRWRGLTIVVLVLCGSSCVAIARAAKNKNSQSADAAPASAKVEDFAWMAGRWTGTAGTATVENDCSAPRKGQMMCMFRSANDKQVLSLEFISMIDTPNGMEEHIRFLMPDLADDDPKSVTMLVESYTPEKTVFVNANGNVPKRNTLTRSGADVMLSHIEIVSPQGKSVFIDARWDRAK
jgi:Domain of unknown function (DUF6265)